MICIIIMLFTLQQIWLFFNFCFKTQIDQEAKNPIFKNPALSVTTYFYINYSREAEQ